MNKFNQSEDRFNLLLKASEDMITIHKPDGEYLYYNGPVCYPITDKEIVGKMPTDLFEKDISDKLLETFKKVQKSGKSETIELHLDWLGEKKWFSEYIYPIKNSNGKVIEIVKICKDINKHKIAEQEIEIQNKELIENKKELDFKNKKLFDLNNHLNRSQKISNIGSWIFNTSTELSDWSDEMFSIWGFDQNKGTPTFLSMVKRLHTDDLEFWIKTFSNASKLGIPFNIEYRICIPNKEQKVVKVICRPELNKEFGKVISLVGTCQDITSQKLFEQAQVKHQRLKAVGEMSSSIAHDFNNSLQGIMGNLEIIKLQNDLSNETEDRLNSMGSIIDDAADRVSILQEFSDTEHNDKNLKLLNFNTLIKESLIQSRPLWKDDMEKEGMKISITTDFGDIPKISCNNGELKSAIYNLIKNSIEAMPQGGDIAIKTGMINEEVFATFTDTGIGMDEYTKLKIFEPFYSTKGLNLGRGLGMSGVYNIVKKHKGSIIVKSSELNKGTTIEVVLPKSNRKEIKVNTKDQKKSKESLNVLWVDDEIIITSSVKILIKSIGHKCTIVNSGKNGLKFLDNNICDIVFTDIGMSEMNGWEFANAIRNKFGNKIKIIAVTGWKIDEKTKEKHGIDYVMEKPFSMGELKKLFMIL